MSCFSQLQLALIRLNHTQTYDWLFTVYDQLSFEDKYCHFPQLIIPVKTTMACRSLVNCLVMFIILSDQLTSIYPGFQYTRPSSSHHQTLSLMEANCVWIGFSTVFISAGWTRPMRIICLYWRSVFSLKTQASPESTFFAVYYRRCFHFHRLPLHTGEPGHTEGIHTLLSFTTCAFVGPRLLLPLWLSPCFEVTISVSWGDREI